jgi:hypothetical protein
LLVFASKFGSAFSSAAHALAASETSMIAAGIGHKDILNNTYLHPEHSVGKEAKSQKANRYVLISGGFRDDSE